MRIFCKHIYILGNAKYNKTKQILQIYENVTYYSNCWLLWTINSYFLSSFFTFSNNTGGILNCQVGWRPPPNWITIEKLSLHIPGYFHFFPMNPCTIINSLQKGGELTFMILILGDKLQKWTLSSTLIHIKWGKWMRGKRRSNQNQYSFIQYANIN